MGIKFEFELDDEDLAYFRRIVESKGLARPGVGVDDVVNATTEMLQAARGAGTPKFILAMLEQLVPLVDMVRDQDWQLPDEDVRRVLGTLSYFADPEDLIPDDVPGLGYLDDAVMVEMACRSLRPELEAYRDFCDFREKEFVRRQDKSGEQESVSRLDWLRAKRSELQERMHSRRGFFGRRK